jgi:hypothetical protein
MSEDVVKGEIYGMVLSGEVEPFVGFQALQGLLFF